MRTTIGIHTTITSPEHYQYPWREAINSFLALADEVVVVYGDPRDKTLLEGLPGRLRGVYMEWPEEWHWAELPKHLNLGLKELQTSWCLKADIDYVFHERDIPNLRYALETKAKSYPLASIVKCNVINRHGFYRKTEVPFAINKGVVGDTIQYGQPIEGGGDWCYPIMNIKEYTEYGVPVGSAVQHPMVARTGVDVYDYDYFFRTKEMARSEFARFARAYKKVFGPGWGDNEEESWQVFIGMMKGRAKKDLNPLAIESHPKFIQERIRNMTNEQFGYNNWNNFESI